MMHYEVRHFSDGTAEATLSEGGVIRARSWSRLDTLLPEPSIPGLDRLTFVDGEWAAWDDNKVLASGPSIDYVLDKVLHLFAARIRDAKRALKVIRQFLPQEG